MENIERELDLCADFIRATWISVVMGDMNRPPGAPDLRFASIDERQKYADSIQPGSNIDVSDAGYFARAIIATDPVAADMEVGKPDWDMKPFLLNYKGNGTKARQGKNGRYNIIPFRHAVPNNSGANSRFRQMPQDIHAMAKQLKASVSNGNGGTKWGGKLTGTEGKYPPQKKSLLVQQNGSIRMMQVAHKNGIYEGMVKAQKQYDKGRGTQYMTFRVVSDRSPASSWWHKATPAQPHVNWVADYCRPKVEQRLMVALKLDFATVINSHVGLQVVLER